MATKRIISLRNNEALVKVEGAVGSVTISLATDLLGTNEVLSGETPTVNIAGIIWTGGSTGTATIARNGVTLISVSGSLPGSLGANEGFFENGGNTNDIVVTTATAETQVWIRLHKVKGYQTKNQPEQFGSYDNPNSATA